MDNCLQTLSDSSDSGVGGPLERGFDTGEPGVGEHTRGVLGVLLRRKKG